MAKEEEEKETETVTVTEKKRKKKEPVAQRQEMVVSLNGGYYVSRAAVLEATAGDEVL